MAPDEKFEPPLEVVPEDNLVATQFSTPNDLGNWLKEQVDFYELVVAKHASGDGALSNAWSGLSAMLQDGLTRFNRVKAAPSNRDAYAQCLGRVVRNYKSKKLIDRRSTTGVFLEDLSASEPDIAAYVAVLLSRAPVQMQAVQSPQWFEAGAIVAGWQRGWIDKTSFEDRNLDGLRKIWEARFRDTENKLLQFKSEMEKEGNLIISHAESGTQILSALTEGTASLAEELKQKITDTIADSNSQIEDFKSTYNQALALRAPTSYWETKQAGHRKGAGLWFCAFVVGAAVTVCGVWYVWHVTVEVHLANVVPTYTSFIPGIGAALLGGWFLRIFSRQIVANLALSADAGERVSMVKTYLALTEGGHARESDRGLILSSLFRSAVRTSDDGAPPTVADYVSKVVKGEK